MPRIQSILFLFKMVVFFENTQAQVLLKNCPDVEVVNDFDATKYLGLWYEYERFPAFFETDVKCATENYSIRPDGSIDMFSEIFTSQIGAYKNLNGIATFESSSNIGKWKVVISEFSGFNESYWILGTDYENYSVTWACNQVAGSNYYAFAWILTREKSPSEETLEKAYSIIDKNKIPKENFIKTEQNCN